MKKLFAKLICLSLVIGCMSVTALAGNAVAIPLAEIGNPENVVEINFSNVTKTEETTFSYFEYNEHGDGEAYFDGTVYYLAPDCTFEGYTIMGAPIIHSIDVISTGEVFNTYSHDLDASFQITAPIGSIEDEDWLAGNLYLYVAEGVLLALDADYVESDAPAIEETVGITATATSSTVLVDGEEAAFEAYNIADNNYFKLRDIASILDGTEANFELTWNAEAGAIEILSDTAYTAVGGEMAAGDGTAKEAAESTASIYLDGEEIEMTAYTINDNNYFKLRDLGETLGFNVTWDSEAGSIVIASDEEYTAD